MEPQYTQRQKLVLKFQEHGNPRTLKEIMELDQADFTEKMKKAVDVNHILKHQGALERIDAYLELLSKVIPS